MTSKAQNLLNEKICVVIPTFRRSDGVRAAIESLMLQTIINPNLKILVLDNNPEPIEQDSIQDLSAKFDHHIDYIHEPNPGVSNARNTAMEAVQDYRYIAFLDDDMCAGPDWLSSLISTSQAYSAGLVFGPTQAEMPNHDDPRNRYMRPFFERLIDKKEDGLIDVTLGMGGCLLDLNYCQLPTPFFNPSLNEHGGEDDIFFDHLKLTGTRVAWSVNAVSYEIVPESRTTPEYIWKRNFGYGQGPARIQASRGIKGLAGILYFMTTGLLQLVVFLPQLLIRKVFNAPSYTKYQALTARAVGKIFWHDKFRPVLYGAAALKD